MGLHTVGLVFELLLVFFTIAGQYNSDCSTYSCKCRKLSNGFLADCSNLNLTYSPNFTWNVISVNLSGNQLTNLPPYGTLPRGLKYLDLSVNKISSFSSNSLFSFSSTPNILTLNLSDNSISLDKETIFKGVFKYLGKLKDLDLSDNSYQNESKEHYSPDESFEDLRSLESLTIDAVKNVTFGPKFSTLKHLSKLKITGICVLQVIRKSYFYNFPQLQILDMSSGSNLKRYYGLCPYTITNIEKGTFKPLKNLEVLDISNNRMLGLCGFKNVTSDLPYTSIKIFKAQYLQCERGESTTLYDDDIKPLINTSLEELYIDGNNLDKTAKSVMRYLPKSLRYFSARDNRWVVDRYMYNVPLIQRLINIKIVDVSFQNRHQMSHSINSYLCDDWDLGIIRCTCERLPHEHNNLNTYSITTHVIREHKDSEVTEHDIVTSCVAYKFPIFQLAILPPYTETIVLESARIGYSIVPIYFSTSSVKTLILRNNQLYSFTGPICNASNLEVLDLSGNRATDISTYVFGFLPNLLYLSIDNNILGNSDIFLKTQSKNIFGNQSNLLFLNMSTNRMSTMLPDIFWNLKSIRQIHLDHNLLSDWNVSILHMKSLIFLDLSWNEILYLSPNGMKLLEQSFSNNITVDISNNPFVCSCESSDFFHWLAIHNIKFKNFNSYSCNYKGTSMNVNEVNIRLRKDCNSYIGLIILSVFLIIGFLVLVCSILVYRFRWKLRYWYYVMKGSYGYHRIETDDNYQFDVFVSYADNDRYFPKDEMVEHLEKQHGLRLCIHHRDFIVGCRIAENITNAIHNSRKMICVLTENFLRSEWCLYEFNIAHIENTLSRQGQNMIVMVRLKDTKLTNIPSEMMYVINEDTYIEYPEEEEFQAVFWDRLVDCLR